MRIGTSIFVIAVGAIMAFAVEVDRTEGFNVNTAGIILMIIGALGFIAVLAMDAPFRRRTTVVDDDHTLVERPARRRVYHDTY